MVFDMLCKDYKSQLYLTFINAIVFTILYFLDNVYYYYHQNFENFFSLFKKLE